MVSVIPTIGEQLLEWSGGLDQGVSHRDVVAIAGTEQKHARPTLVIHQAMDLGGTTTPRTAYALEEGPPLAPPAERCALTEVLSMAALE